jgi:hypothetical protein
VDMIISLEVLYKGISYSESCLTSSNGLAGVTGIKVSEVTVLHCSRRKESRTNYISHYKDRTQVKFVCLVECCAHLTNI